MMGLTVDRIVTEVDDLASVVDEMPEGSVIELAEGAHVLRDHIQPKDDMYIFARDRDKTMIVCDDATGHWQINGKAKNPTFANLRFRDYDSRKDTTIGGSKLQRAWLNGWGGGYGWQIMYCDFREIYPRAVTISQHMLICNSLFKRMGVIGIGFVNVPSKNVLINGCEFTDNDTSGDGAKIAEQGAMKLGNLFDSSISNCYVHDDTGGLWIDVESVIKNQGIRITDNIVTNVSRPGIHYEISHDGLIAGNFVQGCGYGYTNWAWGSQILISTSSGVTVRQNVVDARGKDGAYGNGITIVNQNDITGINPDSRNPGAYHNRVIDNDIIYASKSVSGIFDDKKSFAQYPYFEGGNQFADNRHYVPILGVSRYEVLRSLGKFSRWQSQHQDVDGEERLHAMIDGLDEVPAWTMHDDYVPPARPLPPVVHPPIEKPLPAGKYKFEGTITVSEG